MMIEKIDSNGGILIKYSKLIQYVLSMPDSEITNKGRGHINLICKGNGVNTYFTITPGFNVVRVQWELQGAMLNFKETWNFPEDRLTQQDMINRMEKDITIKMEAIFPKEKSETIFRPIEEIRNEPNIASDSSKDPVLLTNYLSEATARPLNSVKAQSENILNDSEPYRKLFRQAVVPQLTDLDKYAQAKVLSTFFQVEHDNPYFSKYLKSLFFLDGYPSYKEGFSYITQFLDQVDTGINSILSDLNIIKDVPELFRLIAIIECLYDRWEDQESALEACERVWRLDTQGTEHYIYNILKTKADLLIYQNNQNRACLLLQDAYKELILLNGLYFLKYQYAMTLLELSEDVNFTMDFDKLLKESKIYIQNIVMEMRINKIS